MIDPNLMTSPFFTKDSQEADSGYWLGRRKVAAAMRDLIEAAIICDIPEDCAEEVAADIRQLITKLAPLPQRKGVLAYAQAHGNLPIANHEMLCVGGDSHPMSPGLKHWLDGDVVRGSVSFNWSYEGPPQHAHGGWVAAVFDHFMGVAHMRFGKPGMTGGLELRYLQPTPLNKTLDLAAIAASTEGRKTRMQAEMHCEGVLLATATATFIQPKQMIFMDPVV